MLHIIHQSPFSHHSLKLCARYGDTGDTLLLIQNGVYGLHHETLEDIKRRGIEVCVLDEDLAARGLDCPDDIKQVDYAGFVQLCVDHSPIQSWDQ